MTFEIHHGLCLDVLKTFPDNSFDSIVTDPPYGISFMGKKWDYDVPSVEEWAECLRVLKPGGHLLAFAGTRTQHRMAVRIEDAGFEIRDMIAWVYGSGFPKSLDVSKAIDKHGGQSVAWFGPWFRKWREDNGVTQKQVAALFPSKTGGLTGCVANWELGLNMPTPEQFNLIRDTFGLPFASVEEASREVIGQRTTGIGTGCGSTPIMGDGNRDITAPATDAARQWQGWGTALKPAMEPITVARKPLTGTVAANVLEWGTGAINIDGCRVPTTADDPSAGRWPANLIHDGGEEVLAWFPRSVARPAKAVLAGGVSGDGGKDGAVYSQSMNYGARTGYADAESSAARFFYCAKASKVDRGEGNDHPTVKPTDLMRYLCRLVTPPGGKILDPWVGSGSTGKAAIPEGFEFVGIERDIESVETARRRIGEVAAKASLINLFE